MVAVVAAVKIISVTVWFAVNTFATLSYAMFAVSLNSVEAKVRKVGAAGLPVVGPAKTV